MSYKARAWRSIWQQPERPVLAILLAGLAAPAIAQDTSDEDSGSVVGSTSGQENVGEIDVVAGVGVVTNPYNAADGFDGPDASVVATLEIRPTWRQIDGTDSFELQGLVQLRQFLQEFGLEDSYGLSGRMVSRRSERLTIRADGNFSYSESGSNNGLRSNLASGVADPILPVNPLPGSGAPFDDITILGQRSRVTAVSSTIGFDYRLTDRSIIAADISGRALRFKSGSFGDFDSLTQEVRYSRILTDQTSVGVIAQFGQTDYRGTRIGDASSISGLLSVDHRFDERLKGSIAAGLAVTEIQQQFGLPDVSLESFTLRAQLCREGEQTNFCINAQRSPQPSANGSVRTAQSIGLDYSQRISPREQVSLTAGYAHTSRARVVTLGNASAIDFISASASYENNIRQNTSAFASVNFSQVDEAGVSRRANYGANVGIRFKFGASR